MKNHLSVFVALTLASGAALAQTVPDDAVAPSAPPVVNAPATTDAPLPPAVPLPADAPTRSFICSDGTAADLFEQEAAGVLRVTRLGESFALFQTVGSNPPQYVAREGTILMTSDMVLVFRPRHQPVRCAHQPDAPIMGTLWGTITKQDAADLPTGTRAKVMLVDVARADAPALELASTEITTAGNQMPLKFLIRYEPLRISGNGAGRYAMQVRVTGPGDRLLYISDTHIPVFAEGPVQPPVDINVVAAPKDK